jgi:hypothetical protein
METTIQTQKPSLTPKFFFISLGVIVSLITSVSSFLVLFFDTLDKKFPDVLNATYQYGYNSYNYDTIRATLATLIIFFPVFLILLYFWRKISKQGLGIKDNIIFKWMIYLIIFIASIVIIVDLVTLVKYFVSGEITGRFVYKVLGTAVVALLVGLNYFSELKNHEKVDVKTTCSIIFAFISFVIFLGLMIWSFTIMGSPKEQRAWRLDDRRISDLQSIQYQVINYWQQKEKLPANIKDLANPLSGYSLPVDPEFQSGKNYEYISGEKLSFQLCATFSANMPKGWQEYSNYGGGVMPIYRTATDVKVSSSVAYPSGGVNESWDHQAGRTCFTRTIDKDIYPPFPKNTTN